MSARTHHRRRQQGWTGWRVLRTATVVLGFAFVLGPVLPVVVQAFNDSSVFPDRMRGLTLHWFTDLLTYDEFVAGTWTSAKIGIGATALALALGVSTAFAVTRGPRWMSGAGVTSVLMGPIVIPQIVVGLAILQVINQLQLRVGLAGLIVAHGVFVAPFVIRLVAGALETQGTSYEATAMALGSSPARVLTSVTFPMLRPALIASSVFAFTLSFVNVPLSLFLAPSDQRPLPISIYQQMASNRSPVLAALSLLLAVLLLAAAAAVERFLRVRLLQ
ncbi:ABC transporter permease subunit [Nocardioides sp. LHD-245]|uniref:ABC transporter permease n=1 Tax=Nocardioides sp. LHD-245 TaxID=3051387 RepID=UPI0027DF4107|nr:ABC transporter permease subunit [Nocardioides sp. LHD-245]